MIAELRQELSVSRQEITDLKIMHAQELASTKSTLTREVGYFIDYTSMHVIIQGFVYT